MKICWFLLATILLFQGAAHADSWSVRADNWCPYNCEPHSANPGYVIEIIELAAKSVGQTVDYKLLPWSRALSEARSGQITAVVGMAPSESEGLLSSEKMGNDSTCFFVNEGDVFKYLGPRDLANLKSVGTAQDYGYPKVFMDWQKVNTAKVQAVAGDNLMVINVKKLKRNRIQAFLENAMVLAWARKSNPDLKGVVSAGCLSSQNLFVGYGPKNPQAAAMKQAVNDTLAMLKKSGELAKILAKYGVEPW